MGMNTHKRRQADRDALTLRNRALRLALLIVAALVVLWSLEGCAVADHSAKQVRSAVDSYCTRYTPEERTFFRQQVNQDNPNQVIVLCKGDE